MEIYQAIILGIIEGITEYLPVSSTGHLIIAQAILGLNTPDLKSATDAYAVIIQGGAILAVLGLYWKSVRSMILGLLGKHADGLKLFINIIIAFLPAAILGPILDDLIDEYLFFPIPVLAALALGGIWMIALDYSIAQQLKILGGLAFGVILLIFSGSMLIALAPGVIVMILLDFSQRRKIKNINEDEKIATFTHGKTINDITPLNALAIGLFQCVAMWPGTSRSMMTIAGGTMLGLRPKDAAEFSFLLGLPTLGGACVFKIAKDLYKSHEAGTPNMFETFSTASIVIGIVVATIAAALAVKWLVNFLNKHGLAAFGYYRLILTATFATLLLTNLITL